MEENNQDNIENKKIKKSSPKATGNQSLETLRRLSSALEIAQMGYWEYLPSEGSIFWSEQVFRIVEKNSSNFHPSSDTIQDYIHPEDRNRYSLAHRNAIVNGGEYVLEYRLELPSGGFKWLSESGRSVSNESGEIIRLEGTLQDISKQKKEQEELYLQRERERRILDSQTNYILRTDIHGNYTYANRKYNNDFGWLFGKDDVLNQSSFDAVKPHHHQRLRNLFEMALTTNSGTKVELDKHAPNGGVKTTRWDVIAILDSRGKPFELQCTGIDLSDQVAAEAKMKQSNKRYELVMKATSDIIWDSDLVTGRNHWGRGFFTHFGHSLENQNIPGFWERHLHPDDSKAVLESVNMALEGNKEIWEEEYRFKKANGTYASVVDRASITRDQNGKPIRMVGALHDVTEKKRLEMLLHKATSLSKIGSFEYDVQTKKLFWSDLTRQIHEVPENFVPDLYKWKDFFQGPDQLVMEQIIHSAVETRGAFDREVLLTTHRGKEKWVRVMADPVIEQGACVQLNGSVQDIDRHVRAEQEKRAAFEEKERILEGIEDGFFALDENQKITYWNNKATQITGYRKEDVMGKHIADVFTKQIMSQFLPEHAQALKIGNRQDFEIYQLALDRWFDVTLYPIENGSSVFFREITQRKVQKQKLLELNESLQQYTQRLESANIDLEQFSYIVSHNLRAPVANILGLSDLINDSQYPAEVRDSLYKQLMENIYRMDEVIKDLNTILRVKNRTDQSKEVVHLDQLIQTITSSIGHLIKKDDVQVVTDFMAVSELYTVRTYLYSIFYNLISNSIKYRHQNRAPLISISSHHRDTKVILRVRDNGMGMDLGMDKEKLFGLYKRFHTHVEGKGLGLFMVRSQVEMLGGEISVESKLDQGTEFCIVFDQHILKA